MTNKLLKDKYAVVTGATRGIGRAVALAFAKAGAHVIALGRTTGALEELDDEIVALGSSATLVPIDLKNGDDIDRLGAAIAERWRKLDILVANAAILGPISPLGHISPDSWDELMTVNLTANWRLIRSLDPLLRRSEAGRAIFVSSGVVGTNKPFWGGYTTTKAALEAMAFTYAAEVRDGPMRVNVIHPGAIRTQMRAQAVPGEDPMTLPTPEDVAPLFLRLADPALKETGQIFSFDG
jgi:NAD(P)-dependent dehydrogenase (short-subunit alcohol dehydrogenase family)